MAPKGNQILYIDEIYEGANLSGPIAASMLQNEMEWRLAHSSGPFTLDFSGVQMIDSEVFGVLEALARQALEAGRTLILNRPPLSLLRRIHETGLNGLFCMTGETLDQNLGLGVPAGVKEGLPIIVPANLSAIQVVREVVVAMAREMGFDEATVADIELCVGEATVNAVRYGSPNGVTDRLTVRFLDDQGTLVVEILDMGPGFELAGVPRPKAEQMRESGLGLFLMQSLMDYAVFSYPGGTKVRLEKRLRQPAEVSFAPTSSMENWEEALPEATQELLVATNDR